MTFGSVACLPNCSVRRGAGQATVHLPLVRASVLEQLAHPALLRCWPTLLVREGVTAQDLKPSTPPFEADTAPLAATYRVAPGTLAALLDVLAVLCALSAVGLVGRGIHLRLRRRESRPGALERALALTRQTRGRRVRGDRRRALAPGRALGGDRRVVSRGPSGGRARVRGARGARSRHRTAEARRQEHPAGRPAHSVRGRPSACARGARGHAGIGAAVGVLLVSRSPHSQTLVSLPRNANLVLVLDSASVSSDSFSRIGATLSSISRTDDRVSLVVFSDGAMRRSARHAELTRRWFATSSSKQRTPGFLPSFPVNPWVKPYVHGRHGDPPVWSWRSVSPRRGRPGDDAGR